MAHHQLRRLLPRQPTDWRGRYLIEDDPEEKWHDCRVLDISTGGAGLELSDSALEGVEGHHIILVIYLRGEIKHSRPAKQEDRVRVGTEFVDLTEEGRSYLSSLVELDAHW
jgi:hypothetical protein